MPISGMSTVTVLLSMCPRDLVHREDARVSRYVRMCDWCWDAYLRRSGWDGKRGGEWSGAGQSQHYGSA